MTDIKITLCPQAAQALMTVLAYIGGNDIKGPRSYLTPLFNQLYDEGVRYRKLPAEMFNIYRQGFSLPSSMQEWRDLVEEKSR